MLSTFVGYFFLIAGPAVSFWFFPLRCIMFRCAYSPIFKMCSELWMGFVAAQGSYFVFFSWWYKRIIVVSALLLFKSLARISSSSSLFLFFVRTWFPRTPALIVINALAEDGVVFLWVWCSVPENVCSTGVEVIETPAKLHLTVVDILKLFSENQIEVMTSTATNLPRFTLQQVDS